MAISVNFYTLSKKENSTQRPGAPAVVFPCVLKDGSGVVAPEIKLQITPTSSPATLNYAYIPDFGRYYYVTEWTYYRGEWSAALRTDVLATYKTQIGAASLYVLRSAAAYDGNVSDGMYPIKAGITVDEGVPMSGGNPVFWWNNYNPNQTGYTTGDGVFIIGMLSYINNASTFGGINYACMTAEMFQNFLRIIYSPSGNPKSYDLIEQLVADAGGTLTQDEIANFSYIVENPFTDYIKSVMWVPGPPSSEMQGVETLYMGHNAFSRTPAICFSFNVSQPIIFQADLPFANHPLAASRGVYMNMAPFTDSYLVLPRLGVVPIDNSLFVTQSPQRMQLELQLDPISGVGVYILYVYSIDGEGIGRKSEISRWSGKLGVNVALSETKDIGETLNAVLSAVRPAAALVSGDVAGAITGAGAAITNIRRAQETGGGTIGSNDGWLGLANEYRRPRILHVYHDVADEDNAHNGRPLCQVRQISTLPGYNKVQDGDIAIPGTNGEAAEVRAYLEGGFYYE